MVVRRVDLQQAHVPVEPVGDEQQVSGSVALLKRLDRHPDTEAVSRSAVQSGLSRLSADRALTDHATPLARKASTAGALRIVYTG